MKNNILYLLMFCLVYASCQKSDTKPNAVSNSLATSASIIGRWNIVSDYRSLTSNGIAPSTRNYVGTASDFMEFKQNGEVDVNEGGKSKTLNYAVNANNSIVFSENGVVVETMVVSTLTTHSAKLSLNQALPFGQAMVKIKNLQR